MRVFQEQDVFKLEGRCARSIMVSGVYCYSRSCDTYRGTMQLRPPNGIR